MRLHKRLAIGGDRYPLVSDQLTLELSTPGRAVFTIQAAGPVSGLVQLCVGYDAETIPVYILGYVEQSQALDAKQQRVVVRELPATLNRRLPLSLRHCRASEVLRAVTDQTGLAFSMGEGAWREVMLPRFAHRGGGYMALDNLGQALEIPRFIWQQQPDGRVYFGSWDSSPFGGSSVPVPIARLTRQSAANGATLPVVPALRPGVRISIAGGQPVYITRVEIMGADMRIRWSLNPWDNRLKKEVAA